MADGYRLHPASSASTFLTPLRKPASAPGHSDNLRRVAVREERQARMSKRVLYIVVTAALAAAAVVAATLPA